MAEVMRCGMGAAGVTYKGNKGNAESIFRTENCGKLRASKGREVAEVAALKGAEMLGLWETGALRTMREGGHVSWRCGSIVDVM